MPPKWRAALVATAPHRGGPRDRRHDDRGFDAVDVS
jgi:hypothetical protein